MPHPSTSAWSLSLAAMGLVFLLAGCPSGRNLPPPPENEPQKADSPPCGKVFRDPKVRGGSACCSGPAARILKNEDIVSACGLTAAAYLGETRDGTACRFQFRPPTGASPAAGAAADPNLAYVMISRVMVPPGAPAPTSPDPMLAWTWKKVPLRDAIGWRASSTNNESGLLDHHAILWAGRGRRIIGLHVAKRLCDETQSVALLQKAIDAVE